MMTLGGVASFTSEMSTAPGGEAAKGSINFPEKKENIAFLSYRRGTAIAGGAITRT